MFEGNRKCYLLIFIVYILTGCANEKDNQISQESLKNGSFDQWTKSGDPIGWNLSNWFGQQLKPNPTNLSQVTLYGHWLRRSTLRQAVKVKTGKFYIITLKIAKYIGPKRNLGLWIKDTDGNKLGFHIVPEDSVKNEMNLSVKTKATTPEIHIIVGFERFGKAKALIQSVTFRPANEIPTRFSQDYAIQLSESLNLYPFDSANYHRNILNLSKYVNSVLITPLNGLYHFEGEDIEGYMAEEEKIRDSISIQLNTYLPGSNFGNYTLLPLKETANAYCVKSSLSTSEVLSSFHIPSRQIHFSDGVDAFHQFFEYWHPYNQKWIVVDPYYGITYVDETGRLQSFIELKELAIENGVTDANLKHEEIDKFYFNHDELRKGWNSDMFLGRKEIMTKSYAH